MNELVLGLLTAGVIGTVGAVWNHEKRISAIEPNAETIKKLEVDVSRLLQDNQQLLVSITKVETILQERFKHVDKD